MPLAGTRRRTPDLATAEEIAAAYRNGPLRVPKAEAARAVHEAADALGLPLRARLLIRVLLEASPAEDWTRPGGLIGVWPSTTTLMRKTGLSKSALSRAQADLRDAALVAYRDSGNYKRWGVRDETKALTDFRGFDLSPIAARHGELVELAAGAARERRRWAQPAPSSLNVGGLALPPSKRLASKPFLARGMTSKAATVPWKIASGARYAPPA